MTDTENLVLEHLRHIRRVVDETRDDVYDLKVRVSAVEDHLGTQIGQIAQLNKRMDRFDERLHRIENRLGLIEV